MAFFISEIITKDAFKNEMPPATFACLDLGKMSILQLDKIKTNHQMSYAVKRDRTSSNCEIWQIHY